MIEHDARFSIVLGVLDAYAFPLAFLILVFVIWRTAVYFADKHFKESFMQLWQVEAYEKTRDSERRYAYSNEVRALTHEEALQIGRELYPDAYKIEAFRYYDTREDWEKLSPGE